jgi:hypothetical protein
MPPCLWKKKKPSPREVTLRASRPTCSRPRGGGTFRLTVSRSTNAPGSSSSPGRLPRILYQTTKHSKSTDPSQKHLAGRLAAFPLSRSLYPYCQQTSDQSRYDGSSPDVGRGVNMGSISNCGSDPGQKCHGKLPDGNFGGLGLQPLWRLSASRRLQASRFRN